jgi:hypothetical protein
LAKYCWKIPSWKVLIVAVEFKERIIPGTSSTHEQATTSKRTGYRRFYQRLSLWQRTSDWRYDFVCSNTVYCTVDHLDLNKLVPEIIGIAEVVDQDCYEVGALALWRVDRNNHGIIFF